VGLQQLGAPAGIVRSCAGCGRGNWKCDGADLIAADGHGDRPAACAGARGCPGSADGRGLVCTGVTLHWLVGAGPVECAGPGPAGFVDCPVHRPRRTPPRPGRGPDQSSHALYFRLAAVDGGLLLSGRGFLRTAGRLWITMARQPAGGGEGVRDRYERNSPGPLRRSPATLTSCWRSSSSNRPETNGATPTHPTWPSWSAPEPPLSKA
jgi:hypothetical protein